MPLLETKGAASAQGFGAFAQQATTSAQAQAIDFDGTNDYLARTSDLTGNINSKTFTFSAWVWPNTTTPTQMIYLVQGGYFYVATSDGATVLTIWGSNSAGTTILNATVSLLAPLKTFSNILISIDLATANRAVYINDVSQSATWSTFSNDTINFARSAHGVAANSNGTSKQNGRLSNVFLDYTFRDLSITANRRLFITADLKPASGQAALNPIMYLPMSDPTQPGLNQGTGGNFTLTGTVARSGRGPNQYNAPYSTFDGAADYLSRSTTLIGIADGKAFTINLCFNVTSGVTKYLVSYLNASSYYVLAIIVNSSGSLQLSAANSAGSQIFLSEILNSSVANNRNYVLTASIDLSDTSKRYIYLNGVSQSVTWSIYNNDTIDFDTTTPNFYVAKNASTTYFNGNMGAFWFNTSYIDLSVAANLAKFVTGTGINAKPVDLGASGELPTGTNPLIYLPMYANNAGKNYGAGGDFSVNSGPYTGARGPNEFWGNKANFGNSSSNYLYSTTGVTTLSSTTQWFTSFWVYLNSDAADSYIFSVGNGLFYIGIDGSGWLYGITGSGASFSCTDASITTGAWHHIIVERTSGAGYTVYVDGASWIVSSASGSSSSFSSTDHASFGSRWTGSYNGTFNGQISEFYLTMGNLGATSESVRLKFRDCFGNPTDLPSAITAQSVPNPAIYMRFDPASFGTNSGTGGNFTVNGTITDGGQL